MLWPSEPGERVVVRLVLELHLVALALDRVVHRAQQQLAVEAAFDQVVLRAALYRRERERIVVVAGEHDDRHRRRVRIHFGEGVQAEAVGQRQVQDHQRGLAGRQVLQPDRQAVRDVNAEWRGGIFRDHLADQPGVARIVLDKEDVMH
jgi:hypothetical protein